MNEDTYRQQTQTFVELLHLNNQKKFGPYQARVYNQFHLYPGSFVYFITINYTQD